MLAGVAQVLAEHPLDTLKVRIQTLARADLRVLDGVLPVLRATVEREGASALFLGVLPRLLTYGAVKSSLFGLYESFRARSDITTSPALAGALAGLCNTALSCPPEVVKCQCQVHYAAAGATGLDFAQTSVRLVSEHGARSLFVGLLPLALRDVVGYACLFSVYEQRHAHPQLPTALIGGMAGCSFYLAALPADRVRTVMMTQSLSQPTFANALDAARSIVAEEGMRGLYRGIGTTLARTFVGQAIGLSVYTYASAALGDGARGARSGR
jgi:hypothetical protein